jgi:hypothetical protein
VPWEAPGSSFGAVRAFCGDLTGPTTGLSGTTDDPDHHGVWLR